MNAIIQQPRIWSRLPVLLRRTIFVSAVAALLTTSMIVSVALGLPRLGMGQYSDEALLFAAVSVGVKLPLLQLFRLFDVSWRYVSIRDLVMLVVTLGLGTGLMIAVVITADTMDNLTGYAVQWLLLDYQLSLMLISTMFVAKRVLGEWQRSAARRSGKVILVAGAGSAGEQLVHRLKESKDSTWRIGGFLDDDPTKAKTTINGIPVRGTLDEVERVADRVDAVELWIAMPSVERQVIQRVAKIGRDAGLEVKVVPSLETLLTGKFTLADLRNINLEDLLGREPVRVDAGRVGTFLTDRRVLVTGAAGSIGSELCRQIANFNPRHLIVLDQDETGVFNVASALAVTNPSVDALGIVADVCDKSRIESIFELHRPEVVFHAAAYKHVPLMEQYPAEAIKTNVFGTKIVGEAALRNRVHDFVLISTDKAVNPTSVMGATKRAAESIIHDLSISGVTKFVAVRFGNVLGSRGSVIPTFQDQIQRGGPVTVTHPDMRRYFMTTNEAVLLVLQAAVDGYSGQVLVLDMGEPVKIVDLARNLIELAGLELDKDIEIQFTGLRPGEKMFEDILTAEEGTIATHHDRVFVANVSGVVHGPELEAGLGALKGELSDAPIDQLQSLLQVVVPTYHPYRAPSVQSLQVAAATPVQPEPSRS